MLFLCYCNVIVLLFKRKMDCSHQVCCCIIFPLECLFLTWVYVEKESTIFMRFHVMYRFTETKPFSQFLERMWLKILIKRQFYVLKVIYLKCWCTPTRFPESYTFYQQKSCHLRYFGVYGRIILKWILRTACEDADCVHLAQSRAKKRALANTALNLCVP